MTTGRELTALDESYLKHELAAGGAHVRVSIQITSHLWVGEALVPAIEMRKMGAGPSHVLKCALLDLADTIDIDMSEVAGGS